MPPRRKRRKRSRMRHVLLIILLVTTGLVLLHEEFGRQDLMKFPYGGREGSEPRALPEVAIVIDDLGHNRKAAMALLDIKAPLTFSILPHEAFSGWTAREGNRLGHEIIAHIPMEAREHAIPGKGGLYIGMSDAEIRETLYGDIRSIPSVKGVSNHMGSVFTEDEKAMNIVMSVLKKEGLFFLDSLTTPDSVGMQVAYSHGIRSAQRAIFLDHEDDPVHISAQWESLLKIAGKRGSAIALAHPRRNTIEFLKKVLHDPGIKVVPVSQLTEKHL